jgi:hypothetical protein
MPNTLNETDAEEIANEFGFRLVDMRANLILANDYATREGKNAEDLFRSYCSQAENESLNESEEGARNEERAHGRDHDF